MSADNGQRRRANEPTGDRPPAPNRAARRSGQPRRVKEPIAGRWDWQGLLPDSSQELEDLIARAYDVQPQGIDLPRWERWLRAQVGAVPAIGVVRSRTALGRYRRFLFELQADREPPFGGVAEAA